MLIVLCSEADRGQWASTQPPADTCSGSATTGSPLLVSALTRCKGGRAVLAADASRISNNKLHTNVTRRMLLRCTKLSGSIGYEVAVIRRAESAGAVRPHASFMQGGQNGSWAYAYVKKPPTDRDNSVHQAIGTHDWWIGK